MYCYIISNTTKDFFQSKFKEVVFHLGLQVYKLLNEGLQLLGKVLPNMVIASLSGLVLKLLPTIRQGPLGKKYLTLPRSCNIK